MMILIMMIIMIRIKTITIMLEVKNKVITTQFHSFCMGTGCIELIKTRGVGLRPECNFVTKQRHETSMMDHLIICHHCHHCFLQSYCLIVSKWFAWGSRSSLAPSTSNSDVTSNATSYTGSFSWCLSPKPKSLAGKARSRSARSSASGPKYEAIIKIERALSMWLMAFFGETWQIKIHNHTWYQFMDFQDIIEIIEP